MKRYFLFIILIIILGLTACQSSQDDEIPSNIDDEISDILDDELIELTLEELSYYDGKEGRPAYIAVNGDIYDVTDSAFWQMGLHNGYEAGQDLTDPILNESPHGLANLSRVPLIGKLVDGE